MFSRQKVFLFEFYIYRKQFPFILLNRKKTYYKNNYSSKIEESVNRQIKAEQQAGQDYLNIAVTFLHPSKSQFGAGAFFMKMYKEELDHMHKFINYQLLRGGTPLIPGLEPPTPNKDLTLLNAFKQGLCMEKEITVWGYFQLLEDGVKLAEEVKDYHYADFVTSEFLTEQARSINEMATHITKLMAIGDNSHALYHYDLELEKIHQLPHTKQ
uniref:Ferritin n=1 Tax=Heliothis virescens TaxID=7102 RepID=A0A2A4JTF3_HELVI